MSIIDKLSETSCDVSENFTMSFVFKKEIKEEKNIVAISCIHLLEFHKFINWKSFPSHWRFAFDKEKTGRLSV